MKIKHAEVTRESSTSFTVIYTTTDGKQGHAWGFYTLGKANDWIKKNS